MRLSKQTIAFLCLLLSHLLMGILYSVVVPLWEGYDEPAHFAYVHHLVKERKLPPVGIELLPGITLPAESHQPPLYYILAAATTFWLSGDEVPSLEENPWARSGTGLGGRNLFVHSEAESFPYRGGVLAVHTVRLVSVLLGMVTVLFSYLSGLLVFPDRRDLALGAAAITAFSPQLLFMGSIVNSDIGAAAAFSIVVFFSLKVAGGTHGWIERLGLCASVVAAVATKYQALGAIPVSALAICLAARRTSSGRQRALTILVGVLTFLCTISFVLLWDYRNRTYSALIARGPIFAAAQLGRGVSPIFGNLRLPRLQRAAQYMFASFWGMFGWGNVGMDRWVYIVLGITCAIASMGILISLARRHSLLSGSSLGLLLLGLLSTLVLPLYLYLLRGSLELVAGRRLLPAISTVSILLVAGLASLVGERFASRLVLGVTCATLALGIIAPFHWIAPAYARPPLLGEEGLEGIYNPVAVQFGNKAELLSYKARPLSISKGNSLRVILYWRCLGQMDENYTVAVKVLGPEAEVYGEIHSYPGQGNFATSLWHVGDVFADVYAIPIRRSPAEPLAARILVTMFSMPNMEHLETTDLTGSSLGGGIMFGRLRISPKQAPEYEITNRLAYNLGRKVRLVGYDLAQMEAPDGSHLVLQLYWQARESIERDLSVFVHLMDSTGNLVAQHDSYPRDGAYPTSLWQEEEVVRDLHEITLPADLAWGEYTLGVGMYSLDTLQRVPAYDTHGQRLVDDLIVLETLTLGEPSR